MRAAFICIALSLWLWAQDVYNGQVLLPAFEHNIHKVQYKDRTLKLFTLPGSDRQFALLPMPYQSSDKNITLRLYSDKGVTKRRYSAAKKKYREEKLSVAPGKVSPPEEAMERIKNEYREAVKIYNTQTPKLYFDSPFAIPLQSKITSEFGSARVYNGKLEGFHGGTDFRAAPGTPVKAANDGVVVIAKERYYAGKSVVIDHGKGIYSTYYHLNKIKVARGDKLRKGQVLGYSGQSGRVTGPHLHFGLKIGGHSIDPLDFIQKINRHL